LRPGLYNLTLVAAWTLVLMPLQLVALGFRLRLAALVPRLYHRGNCAILGINLEVLGEKAPARPVLFASNHVSWLDIVVLGALIPGSFVAKHEIADWPVAGLLAKLQRSIFIERRRQRAAAYRDQMHQRHVAGDLLILFPEGTSSDGNRVLPFKSSFFAVAEGPVGGGALAVQPVSLAYTRLDNMPMGRRLRPMFAWYGDMSLLPHLWRIFGAGPVTAVVEFHPVVTIEQFSSRKTLAAHCHAEVAAGLSRALGGRLRAREAVAAGAPPGPGKLDTWGANASVGE
jgi:1-acyl-sn-glycerol-3-phosphate acyltransferase